MFLPTAHFVGRRLPFRLWQAQCVSAFLLGHTGLFYSNPQVLCWSNQHQQDYQFSSFSPHLRLSLISATFSSPLPFLLPDILWHIWEEISVLFFSPPTGYNGCPVNHFSQGMVRPMSWPSGMRCSSHPLSHVVSFSSYLSHPFFSFLRLQAYCLIKILRPTRCLSIHRVTRASSSRSLCPFSS